jgi:hypothetical protein
MAERAFETLFALLMAALLACAEVVELFEPRPPAPDWRYRAYRAALRACAPAAR